MTPNATANESQTADILVELRSVAVAFGGLRAIDGVDIEVARGERLVILGPNGAGKTTLFNVIAGDITPTEGTVTIQYRSLFTPSRFSSGNGSDGLGARSSRPITGLTPWASSNIAKANVPADEFPIG